ncbi:dipeptidase [Massilia antarctica]|uniref:dipeptidase n=1 Tax=Massilia antarctica TaxID=2765360 RepID=UPI0006BB90A9|nr:dipeptidase [Massilia sp. H27-R4]MCY0913292.1 dipeptidase [Massilia sp. H27-R4]CUI07923.1 Acetylornithine deacetylase/Succinyl-diaminopimelate desuccinylase and related deacylases [Janthinobacterium sp. CG23_2]CUU31709.1 Acetylornithine deacetylase/Succinyl-diaminopimelate desuccinylase and related deacylases [Janthinobacterium sp. CG23_2]
MRHSFVLASLLCCLSSAAGAAPPQAPGEAALRAAAHAAATYRSALTDSLAKMVSFNTVADPALPFERNPQHLGFKSYLKSEAERLGFDYTDHGYVMVIGLGSGSERVGIITHGDIQPVDPSKWKKSPFELDKTSEAGRLIGRGTEDDKGPIATALYAMKAIKDSKLALSKRLELYVYMAEESDWGPLTEFLKTQQPPQVNITLDAEYPVVTAEKGYGTITVTVPPQAPAPAGTATLVAFGGGFFGSQIPEDASAAIEDASAQLEATIRQRAAAQGGMRYSFSRQGKQLLIKAQGLSAHSSKPEDGVNAISMLADALSGQPWPNTTAGAMVNLLNDLIGTGMYGEKFGNIAYRDKFMGPMTVAPTVIKQGDAGISLHVNLRRPQGKSTEQLTGEVNEALTRWQARRIALADVKVEITEPWLQKSAPQVPTLLSVFSYYTGIKNPRPISIGGGTNSRLFPNAVSFGPAMPGAVYSGHSEHEFITVKQLMLNLQMYTAVMAELAK